MSLSPKMFAQNQYAANNIIKKRCRRGKKCLFDPDGRKKNNELKHNPTKYFKEEPNIENHIKRSEKIFKEIIKQL